MSRSVFRRSVILSCLLALSASAQQFQIDADIANPLFIGGVPDVSDPPVTGPQFAGAASTSGSAAAISPTDKVHPSNANGSIVLRSATFGASFASGVPKYNMGDIIVPPLTEADGTTPAPANYWRKIPVVPGENVPGHGVMIPVASVNVTSASTNSTTVQVASIPPQLTLGATLLGQPVTNIVGTNVILGGNANVNISGSTPVTITPALSYYYSRHAEKVFATQPGRVSVIWVSRVPTNGTNHSVKTETFAVSSNTSKPARTIYWTEAGFDGPRVAITDGRIKTVNPVYYSSVPKAVPEEVSIPGVNPQTPNLKTFFYENISGNGELKAYNREGRIFVEYLGDIRLGTDTHDFIGFDIVDIRRTPEVSYVQTYLGKEILPHDGDASLTPSPVLSNSQATGNFYGTNVRNDGTLIYHAERTTGPANDPDNGEPASVDAYNKVVFYWMETGGFGIQWPRFQDRYWLRWSPNLSDYEHYTVDSGGSTTETGIAFTDGVLPQLVFQDDPAQSEAQLDLSVQRLFVDFREGNDRNRSLLKFTQGTEAWYVNLYSQAENRQEVIAGNISPRVRTLVYVSTTTRYLAVGDLVRPHPIGSSPFVGRVEEIINDRYFILSTDTNPATAGQRLPNGIRYLWFYRANSPGTAYGYLYTLTSTPSTSNLVEVDSTAGLEVGMVATGPGGAPVITRIVDDTHIELSNELSPGPINLNFTVQSDGGAPIDTTAFVGSRIEPPAGHEPGGYISSGESYWPEAYLDPFVTGVDNANEGAIIPVNADPADNRLTVRWFKKVQPGQAGFKAFYVPGKTGRYTLEYPASSPRITIAQGTGTGDLSGALAAGSVYYQNDRSKTGFNPNEEHALLIGGRAYALREDLNVTSGEDYTSQPFVLLTYLDPNDDRPAMAVYRVQRESGEYRFDYPAVAGTLLNRPYPLPLMPLPLYQDGTGHLVSKDVEIGVEAPANTALAEDAVYEHFTFKDRKGFTWVHRGPHDASTLIGASYGNTASFFDVTSIVRDAIDTQTGFSVDNANLGGDPAPNQGKSLTVRYSTSDGEQVDTFGEGDTFTPRELPPALTMQLYYPNRTGFYFPGHGTQPATGALVPFLRNAERSGSTLDLSAIEIDQSDEPLEIVFRPQWPASPPKLRIGETLTLPKFGLPEVRGQKSAEVLYQQSLARNEAADLSTTSVVLHDPTREKTLAIGTDLDALPDSLRTRSYRGMTYFQGLPAHLQQRFYLDPMRGTKGMLILLGEFHDVPAGEDYLDLNALSQKEIDALKDLVASSDSRKSSWDTAVDSLVTTVETFRENPVKRGEYIPEDGLSEDVGVSTLAAVGDADTAVDSYALTATGKGKGYVTMVFGNGRAFTPEGDPVQVKIFQVEPQLYTGDLKAIYSENPLDEQVTLRHSGDFAAQVGNYEFEWRWSTGAATAPSTYRNTMARVIGSAGSSDGWTLVSDPGSFLPTGAQFESGSSIALPRSLTVSPTGWTVEEKNAGIPSAVLRSTSGIDFSSGVPGTVVFSAELGQLDGFVLYVNGVEALAHNAPVDHFDSVGASSGVTEGGLTKQFQLSSSYFAAGPNIIDVAIYSTADTGASSSVNFVLEAAQETDVVDIANSVWQPTSDPLSVNDNFAFVGGATTNPFGGPQFVLNDRWFTMRYRAKTGTGHLLENQWSRWMPPQLVEGWVKRVLAAINPFEQRVKDLYENAINSDVSVLTQAGTRWEGDVALTLENMNNVGLIAIYETVLNRARAMSIDANVNDPDTNNALLLAAGYLNDLYTLLGNEAYADAANPTISVDDASGAAEVNTSRFSFEAQVANSLEEELALLRGRDDSVSPGVRTAPAYNRLYWNYTRGINSGEVLYAVNYNIREKAGSETADGVIDEADAQRMFPQGHGDAYGHYLTALTGYYRLLQNQNFDWRPRAEAVTVLGQPVTVDFSDERKFAAAAGNLARTAQQVVNLTFRQSYVDDPAAGWESFRDRTGSNPDTGITRRQGLDEWVSRSAQGSLYHWAVANAIVPAEDPYHQGVQKIDRTTVPEIAQLAVAASSFQTTLDNANAHLNPLGLSPGAIAFDISPAELQSGNSHFEQVYQRALRSLNNASGAFQQAAVMTRALRDQETQLDDFDASLVQQELAYRNQLIEVFGRAYEGDVGPGKLYAQGYAGPDLLHWFIVDQTQQVGGYQDLTETIELTVQEPVEGLAYEADPVTAITQATKPESFEDKTVTVIPSQIVQYNQVWGDGSLGTRPETGDLQEALLDSQRIYLELQDMSGALDFKKESFLGAVRLFNDLLASHQNRITTTQTAHDEIKRLASSMADLESEIAKLETAAGFLDGMAVAIAESFPKVVGLSTDATSGPRAGVLLAARTAALVLQTVANAQQVQVIRLDNRSQATELDLDASIARLEFSLEERQVAYELEEMYREYIDLAGDVNLLLLEYQRSQQKVRNVLAQGQRLLEEREIFRQRAAAVIQGYRTNDISFRLFRNEALEQYRSLYDLASRYCYLAAKSYDYETGLLGTSAGQKVFSDLVASRSLGDLTGGEPKATTSTLGDSGLAGTMARLAADFSVAEGRLGINNPDANGTVFSLRKELFRLLNDPSITADDEAWRQTLEMNIVPDLLADEDIAIHCRGLAKGDGSPVPGIVISFASTIEQSKNWFGRSLAAGDHAYTTSNFATKIHSVGIALPGYVGMDPYASGTVNAGQPADGSADGLSATPYVYFIPCGADSMIAPPLGDNPDIRSWIVADQALPLPYNLGASDFNATQFFRADGTLSEQPWILRKHQAFRAVADPSFFYSRVPAEFTNSRLIGRSAWNSQWKIVIPANTLLADEYEGLDRFVRSVDDIQLFLRTYSHSGN